MARRLFIPHKDQASPISQPDYGTDMRAIERYFANFTPTALQIEAGTNITLTPPTGKLAKGPVKISSTGGGGGTNYSGDVLVVYGDTNTGPGSALKGMTGIQTAISTVVSSHRLTILCIGNEYAHGSPVTLHPANQVTRIIGLGQALLGAVKLPGTLTDKSITFENVEIALTLPNTQSRNYSDCSFEFINCSTTITGPPTTGTTTITSRGVVLIFRDSHVFFHGDLLVDLISAVGSGIQNKTTRATFLTHHGIGITIRASTMIGTFTFPLLRTSGSLIEGCTLSVGGLTVAAGHNLTVIGNTLNNSFRVEFGSGTHRCAGVYNVIRSFASINTGGGTTNVIASNTTI